MHFALRSCLTGLLFCLCFEAGGQSFSGSQQALIDSIDRYKARRQPLQSLPFCRKLLAEVEADKGRSHPDFGIALSVLGENYRRLGKPDSAGFWLKQGLSVLEKSLGMESAESSTRLNNLGLLYLSQSQLHQADSCIRMALSIRKKLFGEEKDLTATSFHNLGAVQIARGQIDSAEVNYKRALAIRRKLWGENHEDVAASLNNLANLNREKGDFTQARVLLLQALEIRKKLLGPDHEVVGYAWMGLGNVALEAGAYPLAGEYYGKAIAICSKALGPEHSELSDIYQNAASLRYRMGQFFEAEALYQKALVIKQKEAKPDVEAMVALLTNLSNLASDMGNFSKAIEYNVQALKAGEKELGEIHPTMCNVYSNLGLNYSKAGNHALAIAYHQKSVAGNLRTFGPDYHELGASYICLGTCYQEMGQLKKALDYTRNALSIWTKAFGSVHPKLADAYTNLGYLVEVQGNFRQAEIYYQKSLAMQFRTMGRRHPDVGMNQLSLGILHMKRGQLEKAEPYFLRNIQNWNHQIARYFPGLSADEKEKLYNQLRFHFQHFGAFALRRASSNPAILGHLFNQQLSVKGLLLSSSQKFKKRISQSPDSLVQARFSEWETLTNDIAAFYTSPDSTDQVELSRLIAEAEKLEKWLALKSADFSSLKNQTPVTWTQIRDRLKPGEAVVEVVRLEKFGIPRRMADSSAPGNPVYAVTGLTDTVWYAFLMVKPGCRFPELVLMKNGNLLEEKWIQAYRNLLRARVEDRSSYPEFWQKIDQRLGPEVKRVYFSPDGVYHSLNLNTLRNPKTGKYLIESREIRQVTNAKEIVTASIRKFPVQDAFLVGFPHFDAATDGDEMVSGPSLSGRSGPQINTGFEVLAELPETKVEIESIGRILQEGGWKVARLLGTEAQESAIKDCRRPGVLHIATHGFFRSDTGVGHNPLFSSGLLLAGANRSLSGNNREAGQDGILTAYEAMNLNLDNTDLVVLSACETGLGEIRNGEGVYGLQRAFKVAGARSLIMSLWKVDDRATQELMVSFYRNWLRLSEGKTGLESTKRMAFRLAQDELRSRYPEPYYWGAFLLVGE